VAAGLSADWPKMRNPKRKVAFVLAASEHRTMIVNQLD
jgi:hypothetical protein